MEENKICYNHPIYYNSHPSGVECINVIRHYVFDNGCVIKYVWREGLKSDASLSSYEKEIEDLNKSKWYMQDRIKQLENKILMQIGRMDVSNDEYCNIDNIIHPSGLNIEDIVKFYSYPVGKIIESMWYTGLAEYPIKEDEEITLIKNAIKWIDVYIDILKKNNKEDKLLEE